MGYLCPLINMICPSAHADNNSGMLYRIIFIQQKRSNHTDILTKCIAAQRLDPVRRYDLNIII